MIDGLTGALQQGKCRVPCPRKRGHARRITRLGAYMPTQAWAWHRYLCRTISPLQSTRVYFVMPGPNLQVFSIGSADVLPSWNHKNTCLTRVSASPGGGRLLAPVAIDGPAALRENARKSSKCRAGNLGRAPPGTMNIRPTRLRKANRRRSELSTVDEWIRITRQGKCP